MCLSGSLLYPHSLHQGPPSSRCSINTVDCAEPAIEVPAKSGGCPPGVDIPVGKTNIAQTVITKDVVKTEVGKEPRAGANPAEGSWEGFLEEKT